MILKLEKDLAKVYAEKRVFARSFYLKVFGFLNLFFKKV